MSTLTRPERLALLTAAAASAAALTVAIALFAKQPAAHNPACVGYVPATATGGQPVLVPVDLCAPANPNRV